MRASTTERVSGLLELRAGAAGDAGEPVARRIGLWMRAVEIGCFGAGRVRAQSLQTLDGRIRAEWRCERLPSSAIDGLARLLQHVSATQARLDDIELVLDGRTFTPCAEVAMPGLPEVLPFELEINEDLKTFVRVEIEFRTPLTAAARDAVFAALAVWDVLVAAFGDIEHWNEQADLDTRLLSPRIVEHQFDGYFAAVECLYPIVQLALRLHPGRAIERLTLE